MSRAAKSIAAFGVYLLLLGPTLVVVPNLFLTVVRVPETDEVWIRVVGMLAFFLGYYYLRAARAELTEFMRWTVQARLGVLGFFGAFVVLDLGPPILLLFGGVDAAAAIWTGLALRADDRTRRSS